ncbi:MAG: family 20 glycosylhydrolase, partial [Massilibacteroides sp.]|nr:family 20 glycosylhydrolase [Massilibacteroides sp.]
HFFPVKFVKQYIDMMALHGMNVFHWHLTDDQGWRIEIKKYPKLTEIGSVRLQTVLGRNSDIYDGKPYTGFYTQDDAREIVRYAAERYITVIPEIDMPGHMEAALTAYPELGCTGGPYQVIQEWGVFPDILCAGKENTFQFMEDVISELIDIFPAKYFHIGGDEAPKTRWQKCPDCQKRIKEQQIVADNKVSAEDKLQGYFTTRVEKFLNDHGRQLIGWDEILGSEVNQSATIMSWRGAEPGAVAARQGHDVIMTPTTYCYFDYYQTDNQRNEPLLIGGNVPIEKTYNFEPVDSTLTPEEAKHIIGAQANLWTEYIDAKQLVEYQVLPRMGALSEIQWIQPEKKNFEQFKSRLGNLVKIYDRYGWVYARHLWKDKKDVQ